MLIRKIHTRLSSEETIIESRSSGCCATGSLLSLTILTAIVQHPRDKRMTGDSRRHMISVSIAPFYEYVFEDAQPQLHMFITFHMSLITMFSFQSNEFTASRDHLRFLRSFKLFLAPFVPSHFIQNQKIVSFFLVPRA